MKNSQEVRKSFINYFSSFQHKVFPSDMLIPSSDPTLLFTTAGMVQFKDYFLGKKTGVKRACSIQKCLRTSDIEKVGHTPRHLTFFEMLGNFSFGDYFKKEAIEWAWEFITKIMDIDKTRLYISVYKDDDEAYLIWSKILPNNRIYRLSEETNFWKMGDTGPCGPCSEILYDLGEQYGCGKPTCSPACDCDRYLEIWNLVFTQYDLQPDGKLLPLKQKNIDTGMGLERLCMVVNNLVSVFDTDLFIPIKQELAKYINSTGLESYINAISDHVRAATFAISEGVIPTNEGRGYVVRKIIRRAVRFLKLLNYDKPLLYKLVPKIVDIMKPQYPELELYREKVAVIIKSEEEKFLETLEQGLEIINKIIASKTTEVSAETVFKLYDTYGFPKELVDEIFKEHNILYNEQEFYQLQQLAKEQARTTWRGVKTINANVYLSFPTTNFVGYTDFIRKATVLGIIKNQEVVKTAFAKETVELIFDQTPFYGESGGQVGDTGIIESPSGQLVAKVVDTKKFNDRIVHIVNTITDIKQNDEFILKVDIDRRKNIARHHTATHLLHKALRETLGEHATQSGSLVDSEYFRFDFIHWKALTEDELQMVEQIVNKKILECLPVSIIYTDIDTAKQLGATALFEEKYGQQVRMVVIGGKFENNKFIQQPYSIELCGGTHCVNTGEIGIFKIISESSVGTNLRRIEAICGNKVYEYIQKINKRLYSIAELVGTSNIDEVQSKIEKLIQQNKKLQKEIENIKLSFSSQNVKEVVKEIENIKYHIVHLPNTELKVLRSVSDEIIKKYKDEPVILVLYSLENQNINVVVRTNSHACQRGLTAKKIAEVVSKNLNIKLGGRDDFIQGGGKVKDHVPPEKIFEIISNKQ